MNDVRVSERSDESRSLTCPIITPPLFLHIPLQLLSPGDPVNDDSNECMQKKSCKVCSSRLMRVSLYVLKRFNQIRPEDTTDVFAEMRRSLCFVVEIVIAIEVEL